jgi:hypothetical protein
MKTQTSVNFNVELLANRTQAYALGVCQHSPLKINQAVIFGFVASCHFAGETRVPTLAIVKHMGQSYLNVHRILGTLVKSGKLAKSGGMGRKGAFYTITGFSI